MIKGKFMDTRTSTSYVIGEIGYLAPPSGRAYQYMYEPEGGVAQTNCGYDFRACRIVDARLVPSALSIESTGFELVGAPTSVTDFDDERQVVQTYYREAEEIALSLTGGIKARVFDHQLRQREEGRPSLTMGRHGDGTRPAAVGRVHNDYTEVSGMRRLKMVFPEVEPDHPLVIVNLWRPVLNPAIDTPLAVCDARSFSANDWTECDTIYPTRTGEIYLGRHSDAHRWYYYPHMQPDETLVFKTYDSRLDVPARMTPHCAFDDPTAPADAPLRRSMEIRCLVILE
jgi:hypothetical protein